MILKKFHARFLAHVFSQRRTWCSLTKSTSCSYLYQNARCRHFKKNIIIPKSFILCEHLVLFHKPAVLNIKEKHNSTLQVQSEIKEDLIPLPTQQIPRKSDITFPIFKLFKKKGILIEEIKQWYISVPHFSDLSLLQELEAILSEDKPSLISALDIMIFRLADILDEEETANVWFRHVRRQKRFDTKVIMWYLQLRAKKFCSSDQEKELFEVYDELKKQYTVMPSTLLSKVILAYAKTSQWEKCIDMLTDLKKVSQVTKIPIDNTVSLTMIDLYIKNGSLHQVQELMTMYKERCGESFRYQDNIYTLLLSCSQKYGSKFPAENVLEYQSQHWWFPRRAEVLNLINYLKESNGDGKWIERKANLDKFNKCSNCGTKLKDVEITPAEFCDLQKVVLESFVKRNDIYYNSTPEEYNTFLQLIETNDPFDFIVDGLNVFFYKRATFKENLQGLKNIAVHLHKRNQRVLVIARKHLQKPVEKHFPEFILQGRNVHFFYCDTLTNDDSFFIHAAFKSGPNAMIVTNDNLRNHLSYMENFQMKDCFERWRLLHQVKFIRSGLQKPVLPRPNAQKDENGWHIPYRISNQNLDDSGNAYSGLLRYLHKSGYYCLRKF